MTDDIGEQSRFREQLRRQLGYLERSSVLFDAGQYDEAIRLATSIRVLLHDTRRSTSLLTHLGVKSSITLATTAEDKPIESNVWAMENLVSFTGTWGRTDPKEICGQIPVDAWWGQIVHIRGPSRLTRGNIVLFAANQDGGAHVDDEVSDHGQALLEGMWTTIRRGEPSARRRNDHLAMLRTMALEILNSSDLLKLAE
jgi:hypothetical protein